jgi:lysozyme
MQASKNLYDMLVLFEGCKLKAYRCPANVLTIGVGHTGADVTEGMTITPERAMELLHRDVAGFVTGVNNLLSEHATTQNQFDALVSFAYNLGTHTLAGSTLLNKHLHGAYADAALEFEKWVFGGGKRLNGLVKRRAAEAELYKRVDV